MTVIRSSYVRKKLLVSDNAESLASSVSVFIAVQPYIFSSYDPLLRPEVNDLLRFSPVQKIVQLCLSLLGPCCLFKFLQGGENIRKRIGVVL
jgi:hypothetical protein